MIYAQPVTVKHFLFTSAIYELTNLRENKLLANENCWQVSTFKKKRFIFYFGSNTYRFILFISR